VALLNLTLGHQGKVDWFHLMLIYLWQCSSFLRGYGMGQMPQVEITIHQVGI
jgi:hypothetical protein